MKRFEWDISKAATNLKKHDITFDESATVFYDPLAITIFDSNHSETENRFVDIGMSAKQRLLVVVYTERGEHIRIISGRKATNLERKQYERNS